MITQQLLRFGSDKQGLVVVLFTTTVQKHTACHSTTMAAAYVQCKCEACAERFFGLSCVVKLLPHALQVDILLSVHQGRNDA